MLLFYCQAWCHTTSSVFRRAQCCLIFPLWMTCSPGLWYYSCFLSPVLHCYLELSYVNTAASISTCMALNLTDSTKTRSTNKGQCGIIVWSHFMGGHRFAFESIKICTRYWTISSVASFKAFIKWKWNLYVGCCAIYWPWITGMI